MSPRPLLEVHDLSVAIPTHRGVLKALDRLTFSITPGEVLGVVGESGAGKSLTGAAIIGLLEPPGRVTSASPSLAPWPANRNSWSVTSPPRRWMSRCRPRS